MMKILILIVQVTFCFLLLFVIYMIAAIMENFQGGFDNLIGLALFQPILGGILCGLTILVCLIVGLPIRMIKSINSWWRNHFAIAACGIFLGIALIILGAFVPAVTQGVTDVTIENMNQIKPTSNAALSLLGWFLVAFSSLHTYPPNFVVSLIRSFKG